MSLGRGLGSLIPVKKTIISSTNQLGSVLQVNPQDIQVNPLQPRQDFDEQYLQELVDSIKIHGIIQPLIVTEISAGKYQLIAGERRLRASKILELNQIPVIIRQANQQEKLELSLIENVQRADLNPMERARAYRQLIDEFNLNQEEIAHRLSKSRSAVANTLRLLDLSEEIQRALQQGIISEGHAKALLSLKNKETQLRAFQKIVQLGVSVRDLEEEIKKVKNKSTKFKQIDFDLKNKQEQLGGFLGTKVEIKKQGDKGKIIIEFYSQEELDNLVKQILEK
ncbi:MAG: ParB/RepB/Spo0J family partition protein [Candidatus Aenigmarchaeota archaeon]|nr:ParB/RepB/Spo0J family partition protein [Candidatus Aenigmarchaeota archaeon]